jgi:hypothetical protein
LRTCLSFAWCDGVLADTKHDYCVQLLEPCFQLAVLFLASLPSQTPHLASRFTVSALLQAYNPPLPYIQPSFPIRPPIASPLAKASASRRRFLRYTFDRLLPSLPPQLPRSSHSWCLTAHAIQRAAAVELQAVSAHPMPMARSPMRDIMPFCVPAVCTRFCITSSLLAICGA